ncbi:MAG TPA: circularly permuted type 2 ATP-grasp protein [Geminicoccaceae bacterium]|nr:circularly permuted type 2 ATP-grasp protein [Geminicoccaceae bacterium]
MQQTQTQGQLGWEAYDPAGYYCELLGLGRGSEATLAAIRDRLGRISMAELRRRAEAAERELFNLGITFTVYSERDAIDRILPFDVIPRVLTAADWRTIESGVKQRVKAINLFLADVYHDQKILKDGVVPEDLVLGNANFRRQMVGVDLPHQCYVQICGIDIVRDREGRFLVLEDNARTPSGVSYVIENRYLMLRTFADLVAGLRFRRVDAYGPRLNEALCAIAPRHVDDPQIVLLSPGTFNAAYFEHVFLARELGVPLVEGRDLLVEDDRVFMKTTAGLIPVDVIYRRIDDDFLDPEAFRADSMLGVPGLMRAYRAGNLALANAIGTGVADDKAIYAYMPRIIRYYLGEDAILANVETNICREREGLRYTLDHLAELVVKPVGESGGYGITVGPRASTAELESCRKRLEAEPANYISQPMIALSVCPTLTPSGIAPRHVDLRPFAVTGVDTWVLPGGLTRVALRQGSLIVNSSQGGGSKDTWVLG